jgi:hypothetical protein
MASPHQPAPLNSEPTPNLEEHLAMRVTAGLLAGGKTLTLAGHFAVILCALGWWLSPPQAQPIAGLIWAVALLLWPVQCWLGFRVSVDAALFRTLSPDPVELAAFDALLQGWGLSPARSPRTPLQRCEGALQLLRRQGMVFMLQFMVLALGLASRFLS